MMVTAELLIEINELNIAIDESEDDINNMKKWLSIQVDLFEKLYGSISTYRTNEGTPNYMYYESSKCNLEWGFILYNNYIDELVKLNLLQLNSYIYMEKNFMEKRMILEVKTDGFDVYEDFNFMYKFNPLNIVYVASKDF